MPKSAPVPISATFELLTGSCIITFDQPLLPGPSNIANYLIYYNLMVAPPQANAVVAGNTVRLLKSGFDVPDGRPNQFTFSDIVHDLFGLNGMPVAPFAQPFTVI